jgi:DNA-directed RNA polymerase subunit alpha
MVLPKIKATKTEGNFGRYEIAPIGSCFARAFANGLRRVLLSSLEGAALTSVQIEGVQHEFQDISAIKEDVPEIVQNLKKIRLRSYADRTVHVYLDACGEGTVTAGDIKGPSTIEIVTPFAHIATLDNEKACLVMKMTVDKGRGFVEASAQTVEEQPIGIILLDAIYSPVLHVNYTIEQASEGSLQELTKIWLEITTDGTISPDEALRQSAHILRQQFQIFAHYSTRAEMPCAQASGVPIPQSVYHTSLYNLALSVRTLNALKRSGIHKVGQILEMDEKYLVSIRNFGAKSLQELAALLQSRGFLPIKERKGDE